LNVFIRVWLRKNDEYRPIQLQNYSKASSIAQTIQRSEQEEVEEETRAEKRLVFNKGSRQGG